MAKYQKPITVGISILSAEGKEIRVYPNPAKDYLWIDLKANGNHPITISIFNLTGRLIQTNSFINDGSNHFRIDLNDLVQSGMYIYKIQAGNKELVVGKFMKTK